MKIIPAVDLRDGHAVRLTHGDFAQETIYGDDPVAVARGWAARGASLLHIVDLDGARAGRPVHTALIGRMSQAAGVPVQVGGGLRAPADIRATLEAGAARVVLGTLALEDTALLATALQTWGSQIAVGLDARGGLLRTRGWARSSGQRADTVAAALVAQGVRCLIYTDIARDGTLAGPNLAGLAAVQRAAGPMVEVIASGGVGTLDDVRRLRDLGVAGVIVGKALYTGDLDLGACLALAAGELTS